MKDKLLWSWNSDNPETDKIQLPLPVIFEKIIAISLLTIMLAIMIVLVVPILGSWATYVFVVIYALLIPYTLKNYKNDAHPHENKYINIYTNYISINYYGFNSTYQLKNIIVSSIKIKPILVGTIMGVTWSSALCFKTISPKMHVKVPLPILEPGLTKLTNALKLLIARHEMPHN